jgi:hypothetical protein
MPRRKIWAMFKKKKREEKIHVKGMREKMDKCSKNKTMGT